MSKKIISVLFACASLAGYAAAADNVTFDQRGDFKGLVTTVNESNAAQDVAVNSEPSQVPEEYTFTYTETRTNYAKGFVKKSVDASKYMSMKDVRAEIPNAMDLRPKLTQVENQGSCGSCWAFSLTATHRDGFAVAGRDPGRLSQEWLVDNAKEAAGCNGGYFDAANNFVTPGGQPLYSACPYKSGSGKCAKDLPIAAHIKSWAMIGDQTNGPSIKDIETYMTRTGKPVSIGVAAGAGRWQSYTGGVYNACTTAEMDHMINIVGWDNEGAAFDKNGNLPAGKGIWILRNSWGPSWGEKGYMRTKMTDASGKRCNNVAQEAAGFEFDN